MTSLSLPTPSDKSDMSGISKETKDKIITLANIARRILQASSTQAVVNQTDVSVILDALESVASGVLARSVLNGFNQPIRVLDDADKSSQGMLSIEMVKAGIEELSKLYRHQVELKEPIPPPSSYAKNTVWVEWQEKANAILCFRPDGKQGLPLCVLDDVFREFQQQATAPLPSTPDARRALNAAFNLCYTMPNHFATEADRSEMFDTCLDPILPHQSWRKGVHIRGKTEHLGGHVGRIYEQDGLACILREDKVETGTGDDVYMQVSRSYQLYVESVSNENPTLIKQGAPVFLLCLLGPMLLICGGFHDMKSTIVEPLAEPCLLFDDILHIRQEALACKLLALKKAVVALCNRRPLDEDTVNHHSAGVPRIYTTYNTEDNREQSLTISHRLARTHPGSLLFVTPEDPLVPSTEKLVKLAGKYGDGVHRLLANSQFAPVLYGQRSLEGAPTAYIMEFLSPPTLEKSGWVTLFEFFRLNDSADQYSKAIRNTLGRILAVMEEARVVHGDLRPNNLMLEVDCDYTPVSLGEEQGVNMRVIDFDWAGESGHVYYPLNRNEEVASWPEAPGKPIVVGHDRALVKDWWFEQFYLVFPDPPMVG